MVLTRMDTLKSGWTPYVYDNAILYTTQDYIYANVFSTFLRKVGKSE